MENLISKIKEKNSLVLNQYYSVGEWTIGDIGENYWAKMTRVSILSGISFKNDEFLEQHEFLGLNHKTGFHVTLATKLKNPQRFESFLRRLQRLERGLFTLVAPSRR